MTTRHHVHWAAWTTAAAILFLMSARPIEALVLLTGSMLLGCVLIGKGKLAATVLMAAAITAIAAFALAGAIQWLWRG
jgi:hypothetical protein